MTTPTPFTTAYARILSVTNTRTQTELADILNIRQSSISDAKRRGEIPVGWLLTLLRLHSVNPEWIMTGEGAQYLTGTDELPVDGVRINWFSLGRELEEIQRRALDDIIRAVEVATRREATA